MTMTHLTHLTRLRAMRLPLALAALALLSACVALPGVYTPPAPPPAGTPSSGTPATDVAFTALDGSPHMLSEYKGKFIVLALFTHWCPSCRAETPALNQFASDFGPKGAQVVAIEITGAGADKAQLFKDSLSVTYPLFFDASKAAAKAYAVRTNSTAVIIGADFTVRDRVENATTKDYLERMWAQHGQ